MIAILVHGGAGTWPGDRLSRGLEGVREAVEEGFRALRDGGSALDAVEAAVAHMEDDPTFNAGVGCALNLAGEVEAEASIMDGSTLSAGAVALVRRVKNPVRLARLVMERTDHVLLTGPSAEQLALRFGLEMAELKTEERTRLWEKYIGELRAGKTRYLTRLPELLKAVPELAPGTVGAVALDAEGRLAAATSTGGLMLKLPGRLGDTSMIGCGTYADRYGACSATGIGEVAIKLCLARMACLFMRSGLGAQEAAVACMGLVLEHFPGTPMGVITLDRLGRRGVAHTSEHMPWAYMREGLKGPEVGSRGTLVR
ncbi:asparaginase [Candidatus Bathyarchaeota archaeon]|nr:MAG: asparaginase [Candidatus Bathyarchaeota archaeon]